VKEFMTNLQKKIASAVATGAMLLNGALPVLATDGTSLVITGNGAKSDNDIAVTQVTTTTVTQSNVANISNNVKADSNTGNNDASKNTGGGVLIDTGHAATGVAISNTANSNVLELDGCCEQDVDVEISGNGYRSDNDAALVLTNNTDVFQNNYAKIKNNVDADSNTGRNDANMNTGGDVEVYTGDATTSVLIANKANSNVASIGDGAGSSSVSLKILGNGAESDNDINLNLARSLNLVQNNYADIQNKVDADADTGKNDANMNTGGDVLIDTGDATTVVGIDNMANFNFADLNCGCLLDIVAKVAGNGYDSDNTIAATLVDSRAVFQTNEYVCGRGGQPQYGLDLFRFPFGGGYHEKACNDVDADSDTGHNDADKNTGGVYGGDPAVYTGDALTAVDIENTANANILTESSGPDFPELPDFDFDFNLGVNWALLWAWFAGMGV
jgi:hypothetical protein